MYSMRDVLQKMRGFAPYALMSSMHSVSLKNPLTVHDRIYSNLE